MLVLINLEEEMVWWGFIILDCLVIRDDYFLGMCKIVVILMVFMIEN